MKKQADPLVEQWNDMVTPRAIRGHRRGGFPARPLAIAALVVTIVTAAVVTFADRRPQGATPAPPGAASVPAAPVPTTVPGQGERVDLTATPGATETVTTSASPEPEPTATTQQPRSQPSDPARVAEPDRVAQPAPRTTSPPAAFVPLRFEAEAPTTQLSGTAAVVSCATCLGGARVRFIDFNSAVVFVANLPAAGQRTIRVTYETAERRQLKVEANGVLVATQWLDGTSWETPRSFTFTTTLPAGALRLALYNDQVPSPDVDQVTIS